MPKVCIVGRQRHLPSLRIPAVRGSCWWSEEASVEERNKNCYFAQWVARWKSFSPEAESLVLSLVQMWNKDGT